MKKLIPLLLLSSISLTGCSILQNLTSMLGSLEEEESGETSDNLEQAIKEGTWEYEKIIKDIDRVSGLIKKITRSQYAINLASTP